MTHQVYFAKTWNTLGLTAKEDGKRVHDHLDEIVWWTRGYLRSRYSEEKALKMVKERRGNHKGDKEGDVEEWVELSFVDKDDGLACFEKEARMSFVPLKLAAESVLCGLVHQLVPDDIPTEAGYTNLRWMADRCLWELGTMPIDKLNRWIGFIQGVMTAHGTLDVTEERDRTRPIFHKAYERMGYKIPETKDKP